MEAHSSYVVNLHCRSIFINNFLNIKTDRKRNENQSNHVNSFDSHLKNARVSLGSLRFCSCLCAAPHRQMLLRAR